VNARWCTILRLYNGYWSRDPERIPLYCDRVKQDPGERDGRLPAHDSSGRSSYDRGMELARFGEWEAAADLVDQDSEEAMNCISTNIRFAALRLFESRQETRMPFASFMKS